MFSKRIGYCKHIFVAAAAHIHDDEPVFAEFFGEVDGAGDSVAGF